MKKLFAAGLLLLLPIAAGAQPFAAQVEAARGRLKLFTTALLPSSCAPGLAVFDSTTQTIKVCQNDGTTWTAVGGGITSGVTTITGGADTQVCYNNSGTLKCGDAGLVYNETTNTLTATAGAYNITGGGASTQASYAATVNGADAAFFLRAHGNSIGGTTFGITSAGISVLDVNVGQGLYIGTAISKPLGFATNDVVRMSLGTSPTVGALNLERTITAAGTTGAQTINKMSGTVNFAATATAVIVTNSQVDTNSIIYVVMRTNDTTCRLASVVPGSGSFTINVTAACAAETSFGFWVTN